MDRNIVNIIKCLGIDMIDKAGSGHPGIVLGAAPILYTLYAKHMNITPESPYWINRDRFVMSAGHGSALLYSVLYMAGFIELEDLKNFRQLGSKTPGHPEIGVTPGVDMSTGPLGQGISSAVGMAIAGKILNEKHKLPKKSKMGNENSLIDYYVYTLCGDGDLMEGVSYEALSLAGSLKLNNLIVLYDSNNITLDGTTTGVFDENITKRFEAMNFNVITVQDGNSIANIDKAIKEAKKSELPTLIEIKTVIGSDSIYEGTNKVHGTPLDKTDISKIKATLNIPNESFYVNEEARKNFKEQLDFRKKKFENFKKIDLGNFKCELDNLKLDSNMSLREINGEVLKEIHKQIDLFVGGAADVGSSTKVEVKNTINTNFANRALNFGIREHAMGAILNGMALSQFYVYGSTFLAFADYLKPAIRMSSLMNLPVTYVFTHDTVMIGQDGPTHQPVEQINMLRGIPNFNVYRPADKNEIIACWNNILANQKPSAIILSRDKVDDIPSSIVQAEKGGYVLRKEKKSLHGVIIATGSEVALAYKLAEDLYTFGVDIRVVSMPNRELFLRQDNSYQETVLPKMTKTIVIEFGNSLGWRRFVYNEKYLITLEQFGYSGIKEDILEKLELDYESIKKKIALLLK